LYNSEDGGQSWSLSGLNDESIVSAIAVDPSNADILFAGAGYGVGKIIKSSDGGKTSDCKLEGISMPTEFVFDPRNPDFIYVSTEGYGVLRSTDHGKTWKEYDNGIFYPLLYSIDISGGDNPVLVAGSYGSGIYSIMPDLTTDNSKEQEITDSGWMIRPNPNNGHFSLVRSETDQQSPVTIRIFDLTGRKVLESESITDLSYTIDISDRPNGIYVLDIEEEMKRTGKVLVVVGL